MAGYVRYPRTNKKVLALGLRKDSEEEISMRKQKGFSLIELLIVVAIILIIAAIAIPSLIRSRISANDSAAVATLRTLITGEVAYQTSYPNTGYAGTLSQLGPPVGGCPLAGGTDANACEVDELLGCPAGMGPCTKGGYQYFANNGAGAPGTGPGAAPPAIPNANFTVSGTPVQTTTGSLNTCAFSDGVVRTTKSAQPIVNNPPKLGAGEVAAVCGVITNYGPA